MGSYQSLLSRIRMVRRRWRIQNLLKGVALFLISAIALLILGVWGADLFGFKPAAVWLMRISTGAAVVYVALRFLWAPLRRNISDVQIAQYVEERYPQLQDRLVTAMEFGQSHRISPGMLDLLIRDALDRTSRVDFSVFFDRRRLTTYGALSVGSVLALFALLNWGPNYFPYGFERLYVRWAETSAYAPLVINVVPGSVEIPKGSDQQVKAQLVGFDSPMVKLFVQPETGTAWSEQSMDPEPRGSGFHYLLVDVQQSLRYYVESKGVRSQVHSIRVVDLPKVDRIDLTYRFPAYTGMPTQTVEGDGDISALKGTQVDLKVTLTQPAASARLLFDDQNTLPLTSSGKNEFSGTLKLERSGSYVVQLTNSAGRQYPASGEFTIEAIADAAPKVTITKPFRDLKATNVEEVFAELKAEDDIGVGKLALHYSVNGGPEKKIELFGGKPRSEPSVLSTHTFFLEEFNLQPGDVISYFGRAQDNNESTGPSTSSSDIYFIEIRPFEKKYSQSQSAPAPGGQGGEGAQGLSRQQKEIISATFKLIRDKEAMDAKEYVDDLKSLALIQSRLQGTAQGLLERLLRRGAGEISEDFAKLTEYIKAAIAEMEKAAGHLAELKPNEAMPEEQKALQQLMRAESVFREIQVSFGNQSGGGGGQANAEDLADLFELELNKLKNQYETVQRGEQQARDQRVDEALQRLKELAQRQQQEIERNRMLGQRASAGSSGGGRSQQQLIEEAEKLQRQLQRLSRERSSPELNQVSSQLQRAIDEMKRAAERGERGNSQEAAAQGMRALQQLEDARRALQRNQDAGLSSAIEQAADESKRLLEEQKKIQESIERLAQEKGQGNPADQKQRRTDLAERKNVLADGLKSLGGELDNLSRQARRTQREASTKLADASGTIRDKRLPERILQGNQFLENEYYDFMKGREEFIRGNMEELARQLDSAKNSLGQTREGKLEDTLNKTRQLAEGLESMERRLRNAQQGSQAGRSQQQGREGQQSQSGGQQGSRAQGEQAQSGSQQGSQGDRGQQGQQPGGEARGSGQQASERQGMQGGQPGGDVRGLTGNAYGPPIGVGPHSDEDFRRARRETQERLGDAQELRRLMDRNSTQMQNLEQVIQALRRLDSARNYSDPEEVARLKQAIDLLRQVELDLSRELDRLTQKDKYFFSDDNESPANYRKLVEEYYKALAKGKPQ